MKLLKRLLTRPRKLLFQVCCAPCGTYVSRERLAPEFALTWYFYNPNLCCREEYERRLAAVRFVADRYYFPLIVVPYDHASWQLKISGQEAEPERGRRCAQCYLDRLQSTAEFAKENGFDAFSTSLLVSPYKDTRAIREIANKLAVDIGVDFLDQDFQADDGYRRSQELAKELGLYRQKFCGCEYSRKN